MIEAVMYGMMPSAKIVSLRRLPPLKRSKIPSTEPLLCSKSCCSKAVLIPGVGMKAPSRYTPSNASVNSTRLRRSGVLKMFRNASNSLFMSGPCSRKNYGLSSGAGNFFLRRLAECMGLNGERHFQLAIAQNLEAIALRVNDAALRQLERSNCFAGAKSVQALDIHDREFFRTRIRESALRNPALQWHLAAFKSAFRRIAAPRLLPLVARARSFSELRAH